MSAEPPSSFSERDNVRTGYAGNLTPQQQSCFDELMAKASASEYAGDLNLMSHPDWYVLRFLRATMLDKTGKRVFQPLVAEQRLYATLQWRRAKNMPQIRDNIRNERLSDAYLEYYHSIRPRLVWNDARTGRPVTLEKLGLMGQYLAMEHFTLEQWEEFFMYDLERMLLLLDDQSRARGFEISTKVTIMDLSGIGMGMITRLKLLKMANAIMSQHYPEVAGPIFMFNAPWTFSTMYALAQPMLDEDTQKKLVVSSKFDFDLLDRVIGDVQDVIPVEFGGSNLQTLRACAHAPQ